MATTPMDGILAEWGRQFDFSYGVQTTAEVADRLDEGGNAYAESLLTPSEFNQFREHRIRKRRVEWLAGRLAARRAITRHQAPGPVVQSRWALSVLNGTNRAPYIDVRPEWKISLTHSHEYAVAVVAEVPIGIDLERIEPRPVGLANHFFTSDERSMVHDARLDPDQRHVLLTRVWSRKEALVKLLNLGATVDFKRVDTIRNCVLVDGSTSHTLRLLSEMWGRYVLSLAIGLRGDCSYE